MSQAQKTENVEIAHKELSDNFLEIRNRLLNRIGSVNEDRRIDVKELGVKIGCKGDTVSANIRITDVSTTENNGCFDVTITYSGKYTRQGWMVPCVHSPSHEDIDLSGNVLLNVQPNFLRSPILTFSELKNFGSSHDLNHDSNQMALKAINEAVKGTF